MEKEVQTIMDNQSWQETYKEICISAELSNEYTTLSASNPENTTLNRYRDVNPYDHSRVVLLRPGTHTDYINASLVKNDRAKRRYILAQGPLDHTVEHFWAMIWQERCKSIVMLNRLMEKGVKKCEQYWPPNPYEVLMCENVDLRVENMSISNADDDYVLTTLRIMDLRTEETRELLHFQYTSWPDFGVPRCPDKFLEFLEAVRQTGSLDEDVGPPVVHCSAGIGRSGTFCLVDTSLVLIEKEGTESVVLKDILLDLRSYRMGLIQTWEQLKFSYLAIVAGAKKAGKISPFFLAGLEPSVNGSPDEEGPPPLPPPRSESLNRNITKVVVMVNGNDGSSNSSNESVRVNGENHVKEAEVETVNSSVEGENNDISIETDLPEKSTTILNNHKMEERKREVQEQRRRQMKEEKKNCLKNKLENMRKKQQESEKDRENRRRLMGKAVPLCIGIATALAGVALYYYFGRSS